MLSGLHWPSIKFEICIFGASFFLAHRSGDRLIPVIRPFELFRWILHVGPTTSLTFSRGPKGCHVFLLL